MEVEIVTKKEAKKRIQKHNSFFSELTVGSPATHMEVTLLGVGERIGGGVLTGNELQKFRYKIQAKRQRKASKPREKAIHRSFFIDKANTNDKVHLKSTSKRIAVSLELQGEGGRKRDIGTITISTRTMEMKRSRDKHLFVKGNAYGFNEYILKEAKNFDTIRLSDEIDNWKIPVKWIIDNGKYLNFAQQGYELQLFVGLDALEEFKIKPENKTRL